MKNEIISEILSISKELNRTPTKAEYFSRTKVCTSRKTLLKYFPSYTNALRELGLTPHRESIPIEVSCSHCKNIFRKRQRNITTFNFCSRTCYFRYPRLGTTLARKKLAKPCLQCSTPLKNRKSVYCSTYCQTERRYSAYINRWKSGLEKGWSGVAMGLSKHIRKYLLLKYNNSCIECGWNKVHPVDGKPLVEIDHIDGDASNCTEENLRVLCPNCHSMTPTFRARNKVSSRNRK